MSKLSVISGKELIKILEKNNFKIVGQKGSHIRLKKIVNNEIYITVVPLHKEIAPGTLLSILKQSKLSKEDLFD
ncbi:MAG: type II toxin-antitoxin system HicA family toxin [archaeon]|jgi:predicted RNA binding protein YcfA (HicA-like mRNA interferase family)|nr:type II toxin-antitoxin system HicA family toxin [archaeon]MDD2477495.1 type II toxin-antitoxin system HicA family toxin [Candidatus ainarchaeum sp.]MDD3084761.1 type II toxin-antitoxin system HicA family toxin [Candidatus ainarchaeum sp.]MDD4221437.1 type II toxin-antitoxin system HicA family toxin [Candidatus ainarchaeum sp.]MDD4662402.1 type II toxin-antitoxin system HicA family toxin [Candidatus ainarchaeum sp.]